MPTPHSLSNTYTRSCVALGEILLEHGVVYKYFFMRKLDLTGKIFDRLHIVRLAYVKKRIVKNCHIGFKNYWLCKCKCGVMVYRTTSYLLSKKTHSCGCISREHKLEEKNPMWKGIDVGYNGIHHWVKSRLKKPTKCLICKKVKKLDLANISQSYKRDLTDWEWLCRRCHMLKDGRLKSFNKYVKLTTKDKNVCIQK